VGNAPEFFRDPVAMFQRGYDTLGPIFSVRLGPKRAVVLIGPSYQRFFFTQPASVLSLREVYRFVTPMFGDVLQAAEPTVYEEHRSAIAPALRAQHMNAYVATMTRETEAWLSTLGHEGELGLWCAFGRLSLRIAAATLFGTNLSGQLGEEFWELYEDIAGGMAFVLPAKLPLPRFRRRDRARTRLFALIGRLVAERRARPDGHVDFLQSLISSRRADGSPLSDGEVCGLALALVFAAYDTTAAQLCWVLILLLQHSAYLGEVLAEQARLLGDPAEVTPERLAELSRLGWAINEANRLRPITTMLWRHTARSYELGGYRVPKGWVTIVCPPVAHRLPEVFPDPDAYDPMRFSPERISAERGDAQQATFRLINFGGGAHYCLGLRFAELEMKAVLTLLLRRYELTLAGPTPVADYREGIGRPQDACRIRYRRTTR
jgi:sterol 14-demethylase